MRLILFTCLLLSGCASSGMNSICGHVNGSEMTVPYIGGKGNADAYACHLGCAGMSCPKANYADMVTLTDAYLKVVEGQGKITTSSPGVITFTPTK